jgi:aspartyl-tRNA(Asn)/glutamyl-tRNA(Gln) amidotransferase subunit B
MGWEIVIGLECHVQLKTASKIFSPASTQFGAAPNTQAHMVDMALPGVLPVMNREAAACAIRLGLAVGGQIAHRSIFARKNYFYPDLPKGYQISQYETPVVSGGQVVISIEGQQRPIELTRAHLEEDAGKSIHEGIAAIPAGCSGIDLNRAGTPLLEIVSEPVRKRGGSLRTRTAQPSNLDRDLRWQSARGLISRGCQCVGAASWPARIWYSL